MALFLHVIFYYSLPPTSISPAHTHTHSIFIPSHLTFIKVIQVKCVSYRNRNKASSSFMQTASLMIQPFLCKASMYLLMTLILARRKAIEVEYIYLCVCVCC